uniref:Uncharacterized protein n=1 Tax=Arundo donax TaxID=35708 RepID=A0A0A8YWE6_ARUDO
MGDGEMFCRGGGLSCAVL